MRVPAGLEADRRTQSPAVVDIDRETDVPASDLSRNCLGNVSTTIGPESGKGPRLLPSRYPRASGVCALASKSTKVRHEERAPGRKQNSFSGDCAADGSYGEQRSREP